MMDPAGSLRGVPHPFDPSFGPYTPWTPSLAWGGVDNKDLDPFGPSIYTTSARARAPSLQLDIWVFWRVPYLVCTQITPFWTILGYLGYKRGILGYRTPLSTHPGTTSRGEMLHPSWTTLWTRYLEITRCQTMDDIRDIRDIGMLSISTPSGGVLLSSHRGVTSIHNPLRVGTQGMHLRG